MNAKSMLLGAAILALGVASARAQSSSTINVVGTVDYVDANSISIKSDDGGTVESFKLALNWLVLQNKTATLADIKPNDFLITHKPQPI